MRYITVILIAFILISCNASNTNQHGEEEGLTIIDQNFSDALDIANKQDKLLFIDFYTDWCQPCKKLDKLVFQNDSIQEILGKDYVLLRYDAENDTIFHLSKKH
ncbi:MAG: thioredoxin family protein, partial [Bacteroidota bacterium]